MSETFKLETEQTLICDECSYAIPSGPVWFCPGCFANLCDECYTHHHCEF